MLSWVPGWSQYPYDIEAITVSIKLMQGENKEHSKARQPVKCSRETQKNLKLEDLCHWVKKEIIIIILIKQLSTKNNRCDRLDYSVFKT